MEADYKTCSASAAGKVIISGEHAVVFGQPALAIATRCKAKAVLSENPDIQGIYFDIPNLDYHLQFDVGQLKTLHETLTQRYQAFLNGDLDIDTILDHPIELIPFAFSRIWKRTDWQPLSQISAALSIDIPIGCGMGSSAAVGLSMLKATADYTGISISEDDLFQESMACERLMHGHPSGVDTSVSLYGGAFRFENGNLTRRSIPNWPMILVNTGQPVVSTGECVESVRRRFGPEDPVWKDFGAVTNQIDALLERDVDQTLLDAVRENHRLLCRIGVVPERVQKIISAIEEIGGAAKICGAGAVSGNNAGIIMVVGDCELSHVLADHSLQIVESC